MKRVKQLTLSAKDYRMLDKLIAWIDSTPAWLDLPDSFFDYISDATNEILDGSKEKPNSDAGINVERKDGNLIAWIVVDNDEGYEEYEVPIVARKR